MDNGFAALGPTASGYRLEKIELYNWGTFDSRQGNVHSMRPGGATTLLVGQNGSGKSTLVDAILTLLVRPVVRNYNVAAGAHKQERDEKTYIKGALAASAATTTTGLKCSSCGPMASTIRPFSPVSAMIGAM